MGVRTASARHLHVLVMAPALTDTEQSQKFSLSPKTLKTTDFGDCLSESVKKITKRDDHQLDLHLDTDDDNHLIKNATKNINLSAVRSSGDVQQLGQLQNQHSPKNNSSIGVMNNNIRMDDPQDKMGLEKARIDNISSLVKDKSIPNDVDQLLNNFEPDLCENDAETVGDIPPPNVDEIMQVIKSMEATNTADSMFSLTTDLTTNLSPFEKELLNDVDVMNMSMDDQLLDGAATLKENQTKEVIAELQKRQLKIERRVDFLLRRLRKIQVKHMGQHVSNEIAGVFEHANRTLRKAKEAANNNAGAQNRDQQEPPPPPYPSLLQETDGSSEPSATIAPPTTPTIISKEEKLKPISQSSAKSLVRKLETSTLFQATIVARQKFTPRYFGSGSVEPACYRSGYQNMTTLPPWSAEHKAELQKVAGSLHTQLRIVQQAIDSEATASSSGGESCDEFQTYGNPHQQYLSIQKRAAWRYATDRAAIASRWTWLQAQIADLEYRIRQYADLQKLVRANKGPVLLEGEHEVPSSPSAVNGYRGQLPGASPISYFNNSKNAMNEVGGVGGMDASTSAGGADCYCARSRPLRCGFRKRKLVQIAGLHAVSKKAARPSTIRCGCTPASGLPPCAVCTGRTDPTHPKELTDCLNTQERIALIDPAFHPVISFPEDVSSSIHLEAIMKTSDWQMKSTKSNFKTMKFNMKTTDRRNKTSPNAEEDLTKKVDHRRKYNRLMKTKMKKIRGRKPMLHSSLSRLRKKRHNVRLAMAQLQSMSAEGADEETEALSNSAAAAAAAGNGPRSLSGGNIVVDSPCSSPLLTMQAISGYSSKQRNSRVSSYDIDNIVIPYSVAASTRVEKLQYKEILTPKWRLVDPEFAMRYTKTNGVVRDPGQDSDVEDLSEEALVARHEKSEHEEKKKFLSYLKFPVGYGRSRSHKRTDSRAESSGCNTPDPMSPHPVDHANATISGLDVPTTISGSSPVLSPPATPLPANIDDGPLPSVSVMRKRTISQSTRGKDRGTMEEEDDQREVIETTVTPYDRRTFPLAEDAYDKMLKQMPEDHRQCCTNSRSQDVQRRRSSSCFSPLLGDEDDRRQSLDLGSPMVMCGAGEGDDDSESTESAYGDEDPNDPEWSDLECVRDRYAKR